MGSTPEELNTEIAGTREALATNMDALQDRVSPHAILDRRKAAARSRAGDLRSRVMGSPASSGTGGHAGGVRRATQEQVDGHPLAAGAIAFLAGVVASAAIPATAAETKASRKAVDAIQEHGEPMTDALGAMGRDLGDDLTGSAGQAAHAVKDRAQDSLARVKNEGRASVDTVRSDSAE